MLRRRLHFSALSLLPFALACNDNTPTYPAIVIYGDPNAVATGASDGTGATGDNQPGSGGGESASAGAAGANSDADHCADPWSGQNPPVGTVQCDLSALADGGELTGLITADQTLTSGNSYRLNGEVRVQPGVTLTIQPCVQIIGESSASALVVSSGELGNRYRGCTYSSGKPGAGGKLIAVGEPMAPIIFTSSKPKGARAAGDWQGIYLMGNAQNNLAVRGIRAQASWLAGLGCHGWNTSELNEESSGQLAYVRIEYAGLFRTDGAQQTGALTLASVGSGTELHHVMISNSADGSFGFLGGAPDADHLIALNGNSDLFDEENGYSGKLQFLFGRQFPTTSQSDSHGIAVDGAPSLQSVPPTSAQISNFTLCGGGPLDLNASRDGAALRHSSSAATLMNGMLTGFAGAGLFVQTDQSNQASVSFVQVFNNAAGVLSKVDLSNPSVRGEDQSWFLQQDGNTSDAPVGFCDCWANPPVPFAARAEKGTKPTGFVDESADYIGAFKDPSAASNWMRGAWVDWSSL